MKKITFFALLGLSLIIMAGCAKSYLEIKNGSGEKLELTIKREDVNLEKKVEIENGGTKVIEIALEHTSAQSYAMNPLAMSVTIYLDDKDVHKGSSYLDTLTLTDQQTLTVRVKSSLLSCPKPQLIGTWKNSNSESFVFSDNNKCKISESHWNREKLDYFEWYIDDGKFYIIDWYQFYIDERKPKTGINWDYIEILNDNQFKLGDEIFIKQ